MSKTLQTETAAKHSTYAGLLLILAFAVYANSLFGGFVMDDHMQIEQNPQLQNWRALPDIFVTKAWSFHATQYVPTFYRPIPISGFLLGHKLFGPNPFGYHLINVLLHLVVVWLVFAVGLRLYQEMWAAFLAAVIFALHPIHAESVSWIAGVMDIELSIFFLLSLNCFLGLPDAESKQKSWWQAGMYLSFVGALLCKEQAVTLPFLVTAYEHWFRTDHAQTSWRQKIGRYGGYWILLAAYFLFRATVLGGIVGKRFHEDMTTGQAIAMGFALVGKYVGKMFWPAPLSYYYPLEKVSSFSDPVAVAGFVVLVAALAAIWMTRKRQSAYAFSVLFFVLTLSPVLNPRWMPGTIFAERYLYLPSVGFCWIFGACIPSWWRRWATARPTLRWIFVPVGLLVALLAAQQTWARNRDWKNDRALVLKTLEVWPHSAYHRVNFARMVWDEGDHAGAERQLEQALRDDPKNPVALWDLGKDMLEEKKYPEAMDFITQSLAARSEFAPPYYYRGRIYAEMGHPREAEADFLHALEISPNSTEFRNTLGKFYWEQGRAADAEQQFLASINSVPTLEGYRSLGEIYTQRGATGPAEAMWKNVLQIEPFAVRARFQLGKIYMESGRRAAAKEEYEQGIALDPHNAEAQAALRELEKKADPAGKN